jgi:uncharacterized protein (TIGR02996 family)
MSDVAGLMQAIHEQPDDDLPRLAFADWCEEQGAGGAARAEFIRTQIEHARLSPYDPRRHLLHKREEELLAAHRSEWLGKWADFDIEFRRGFGERVRLGVRQFMDHAEELFRFAPIQHMQLLRVNQTRLPMSEVAAHPCFARLQGLSLRGSTIGDDRLAELLKKATLDRLEVLDLTGADARDKTFKVLRSAELPCLHALHLANNYCPPGRFAPLLTASFRAPLRTLDLAAMGLVQDDLDALFSWPGLPAIEDLNLQGNRLNVPGGRRLASAGLHNLRSLDLGYSSIGVGGMQALASSAALAGLRRLNLNGNGVRMTALVGSPYLVHLEALSLTSNHLNDAAVRDMAGWSGLAGLRELSLAYNFLSSLGVKALTASPHLGDLVELNLGGNSITDTGAQHLASCPRLRSLESLYLRSCRVGDKGIRALLGSPHLVGLRELRLSHNAPGAASEKEVRKRFPSAFT